MFALFLLSLFLIGCSSVPKAVIDSKVVNIKAEINSVLETGDGLNKIITYLNEAEHIQDNHSMQCIFGRCIYRAYYDDQSLGDHWIEITFELDDKKRLKKVSVDSFWNGVPGFVVPFF